MNRKLLFALVLSLAAGALAQTSPIPAAGPMPALLPAKLTVGLFEDTGQRWMRDSGVRWDVRYRYLTKGWVNNWGWSARDGSFALQFFKDCEASGQMPAVAYYQLVNEPGGGEAQALAKTQNATTMREYFTDVKLFLQRAKEFGKPVMMLVEADGFGELQQQSQNQPNTYAAIAATGLPELAALPNTVAGWGQAFLALRKAVGASNVVMGLHVSAWTSGKDVMYGSVTVPLQPEVDKGYAFLSALGLGPNGTGATYDVLVGDPLDRDADYWLLTAGMNRWWDASDTASISSQSFNRYAEWLRLWNITSNKRWVLWQIPMGNSNHRNVWNDGTPRAGYRDNRPEYFFGPSGAAHREKFARAGVISLLFGAGADGMSGYKNDVYTDGQLFLKTRAGAYVATGGLPLMGGTSEPPPPPPPPQPSGAQYGFELDAQGWTARGAAVTRAAVSTTRAFEGTKSLGLELTGTGSGLSNISVASPAAGAGKTVTFHLWLPAGGRISAVQLYALEGAAGGWRWTGNYRAASTLTAGAWNTLTLTLPANATPLYELGLEVTAVSGAAAVAYLDSVAW